MSGHTAMGAERGAMPTFSPSLVLENPGDNGPSYFHNELRVSGWAADTEQVTVELAPLDGDGNVRGPGVKFSERLQTSVEARKSRFDLRVRTGECSRGTHFLNVSVTGRDGAEVKAGRIITIEPYEEAVAPSDQAVDGGAIVLSCEAPGSGRSYERGLSVLLRGWCYATGGIERVVAFLDGRLRHDALFPVPRPDVEQALQRPDALLSGFALPLDAEACPPGEHSLTLLVAASDGRRAGRTLSFRCGAAAEGHGTHEQSRPPSVIDPSMDRSELVDRCEFESLRATVAERHAFVSLTESNIVTEAYHTLQRSQLALQQELEIARRAGEAAEQRAAAAEHWLQEQRRSLSWRITKPLRAFKQAARRVRT